MQVSELKERHLQKRDAIEKRLQEFREVYNKSDYDIFCELCFCLLTPQTKAKSAAKTIEKLREKDLIAKGDASEINKWMAGIRFNNNKSSYIILARKLFMKDGKIIVKEKLNSLGSPIAMRSWLLENVKGYGLKEASHFLRNVGFGDDIAILDRHILKHLAGSGVIPEVPKSMTEKKYLEIEQKMKDFSKNIGIPMAHLDLLWWSEETGEIFK